MKIIYVTLNNSEEARKIGRKILEQNLANCVNFFPITCIYNYKNELTEEPEVVLIIKTVEGKYSEIEEVLTLLHHGGFYVIDDMSQQPNWPVGHEKNVERLIDYLENRSDLNLTKMNWSTGLVVCTKK